MPCWARFVISIDGRDCSGKSSLGRYLSWQLGMPCMELDTFRYLDLSPFDFRLDELHRSINSRLERDRPVILEGVTVRKVLAQLGYSPDYSVFIKFDSGELAEIDPKLKLYFADYTPAETANYLYDRRVEIGA